MKHYPLLFIAFILAAILFNAHSASAFSFNLRLPVFSVANKVPVHFYSTPHEIKISENPRTSIVDGWLSAHASFSRSA